MTDSTHGRNLVRFPRETLASLLRRLASGRSATDAAIALREAGVEAAGPIYTLLEDRLGRNAAEVPTNRFWSELGALFGELGWGELRHDDPHPGVISLDGGDWFEATGASSSHPSCHFSTGLLAELFRKVAGTELASMEVECRGAGAASCRFLVGSPAALEAIFDEMSRGGSYQSAVAALA